MTRRHGIRIVCAQLVGAALLVALSGCAGEDSASDQVPALTADLEAVDTAIAAEDYATAREALDALVATATTAEKAGELDDARADAILAAAARLEARLPDVLPPDEGQGNEGNGHEGNGHEGNGNGNGPHGEEGDGDDDEGDDD